MSGELRTSCLLPLFLIGCLSGCSVLGPSREGVFSDDWVQRQEAEKRDRVQNEDELVLVGKEGGPRAYVYRDEKGAPQFAVGGTGGLSADIRVDDGDPEVKLKYRLGIGRRRRSLTDTAPPHLLHSPGQQQEVGKKTGVSSGETNDVPE